MLTKSQINKLGERLRAGTTLDIGLLALLQEFRATFDGPMSAAQAQLKELGLEASSRLKTVNTIIEKLRREKTRLAEMQDIAGLRIVADVDLAWQDAQVDKIVGVFPIARIIDRRANPSHGYRAVHIIATLGEHAVEIQVRTHLQDLWAQAMERLADEAGRAIRYGGAPERRGEDVDRLLKISLEIATIEVAQTELARMRTNLPVAYRAASNQHALRLHQARLATFQTKVRQHERSIRAMLKQLMQGGRP